MISDIGTAGDDTALLCHTDRPPTGSGNSAGNWYSSDGTAVHRTANVVPGLRRNRGPMAVQLYRDTATGPPAEGIYYCQIQDYTNTLQTVTVGLYNSTGGIISQKIILHDSCTFIGIDPVTVSNVILFSIRANVFDITCISTGGPATTVTWTRDSVTVTEGTVTHYDTSTYKYTHTLTVVGRTEGLYICTVANDRPSTASAHINVQGKVFVSAADIVRGVT